MVNFNSKITASVLAFLLFTLPVISKTGQYAVYLVKNAKEKIALHVYIADSPDEREKGLMFVESLPWDQGMLFVFEYERRLSFWMKNTYIPLDIAYISKNGIINEIYYMKPLDYSITYPSKKPAMYALEVNAGWFKKHGIAPGMKLDLNGCIGK